MESGITSLSDDEPMSKRNRLMNEVGSMRRKVPNLLISLEEKIQRTNLKTLVLKEYPPSAVQEQLEHYVAEKSPCEGRRVPNLLNDLKSLKTATAKVEEVKAILQEREKNSIDFSVLIKKSQEAQERLHLLSVARRQLANENPLITRARQEGYSHMMQQGEKENLESQVPQS